MQTDDPVAERLARVRNAVASGRLRLVEPIEDRRRRIEALPFASAQPDLTAAIVSNPRVQVDVAADLLEVAARAVGLA